MRLSQNLNVYGINKRILILSLGQSKSNMGRPKGSKNRNKPVQEDSSSTLKMVLKLSAQEHAASSPASPSTSAVDSDEERSKSGSKRSRSSVNKGTPSKVARKGKKMGWVMICVQTAFNLKPPGALNLYCVIYRTDILFLAFCLLSI